MIMAAGVDLQQQSQERPEVWDGIDYTGTVYMTDFPDEWKFAHVESIHPYDFERWCHFMMAIDEHITYDEFLSYRHELEDYLESDGWNDPEGALDDILGDSEGTPEILELIQNSKEFESER